MLNNYAIYEVHNVLPFEKPYYFITKLEINEFDRYIRNQNIIDWICYSWIGFIKDHKIIDNCHHFKYWSNGTVS